MKRIIIGVAVLLLLSGCSNVPNSESQSEVITAVNGQATQDIDQYIQNDLDNKINEALDSTNQSSSIRQDNVRSQYDFPLEVCYKTKEYKNYANMTTLTFYFSVCNKTAGDLKTPACDVDFLDKEGNVIYSDIIFHNGVLKSGQESEDFIPIDDGARIWEKKDEIDGLNILNYYDEDTAPYTLDEPIYIPFS